MSPDKPERGVEEQDLEMIQIYQVIRGGRRVDLIENAVGLKPFNTSVEKAGRTPWFRPQQTENLPRKNRTYSSAVPETQAFAHVRPLDRRKQNDEREQSELTIAWP